jgi:hypothetical protein
MKIKPIANDFARQIANIWRTNAQKQPLGDRVIAHSTTAWSDQSRKQSPSSRLDCNRLAETISNPCSRFSICASDNTAIARQPRSDKGKVGAS